MASRTISWQQVVEEADPNWQRDKLRPKWYYFSNGKIFKWNGPGIYTQTTT